MVLWWLPMRVTTMVLILFLPAEQDLDSHLPTHPLLPYRADIESGLQCIGVNNPWWMAKWDGRHDTAHRVWKRVDVRESGESRLVAS